MAGDLLLALWFFLGFRISWLIVDIAEWIGVKKG